MEFLSNHGKEIVSLLVPFITWFLNIGIKAKAKLIWASPHSFTFLVQEPLRGPDDVIISNSQKVCTASIRVINIGRETANKVELVFNWKPQHLNLWPVRHYESICGQDSRHILVFDNLSPKEEIGIETMSINADLPALIQVRSAECQAKNVPMMWIAYVAPWKIAITRAFLFLGLGAFVYSLLVLIQFLVLKTPS